jgi:hypothetical protein
MSNSSRGRLVWNHSTHLPGLIEVLEKLTNYPGINTITPAVIGRTNGHVPKLRVKLSVPIRGGYKAIARSGKTFQEVFISTTLTEMELEEVIAEAIES